MVITPATYAHLSATPWIDPVHPGPVVNIQAGTAQHQVNHLRDIHQQAFGRFQLADTVNTILTSQIKNAIEEDYLADEVDTQTGKFNDPLTTTIQNLFAEYGSDSANRFWIVVVKGSLNFPVWCSSMAFLIWLVRMVLTVSASWNRPNAC